MLSGDEVEFVREPPMKRKKVEQLGALVRKDIAKAVIVEKGKYFQAIRQRLRENPARKEVGEVDLPLATHMDERIILSNSFMEDGSFIKIDEFKSFLIKLKQNELRKELDLGEGGKEKNEQIVQALQQYDPNNEDLMVGQARFLVENSGMLLLTGWDIHSTFIIDQIIRQSDPLFRSEFDVGDFVRGSGFDLKSKRLAIWSLAPATQWPHLMNIQGDKRGDIFIWNLQDTRANQIADLMTRLLYE